MTNCMDSCFLNDPPYAVHPMNTIQARKKKGCRGGGWTARGDKRHRHSLPLTTLLRPFDPCSFVMNEIVHGS